MTINTTTRLAGPYVGNGVQTVFAYAFKVFATSDLIVTRATAAGVETILVLGVDYTATMNADQDAAPGGNVTLGAALAAGSTLTITSEVPQLQSVAVTNGGGFFPSVFNGVFDRLTILIQQLAEKTNRSIKFTKASALAGTALTPVAGGYLRMNAGNTALELVAKATAAADLGVAVAPAVYASAVADAEAYADTFKLSKAANLSDVASVATARGNLGFVAALDALWTAVSAAAARTALGLGTAAVANTGTGVGNVVVLDAVTGKLPAVDGSLLTGINGLSLPVVAKTASYTHTASENSAMYEFSGALTSAVVLGVAPATVGNTHWFGVDNKGTGPFVITPSAGTIDGLASIFVYPGERFLVRSDGAALRTIGRLKRVMVKQTVIAGAPTTVDFEDASGDTEAVRWVLDLRAVQTSGGNLGLRFKKSAAYQATNYNSFAGSIDNTPALTSAGGTAGTYLAITAKVASTPVNYGQVVIRNVANGLQATADGKVGGDIVTSSGTALTIGCSGYQTTTATALQGVRVIDPSGGTFTNGGTITLYIERE